MALGGSMNFDSLDSLDTAVAPVSGGVVKKGTQSASKVQFDAASQAAYDKMSDEEKTLAGSKSDTLTFLGYIGFQSKTSTIARKDAAGNQIRKTEPKPVGVLFKSSEPVTVPLIDVKYTHKTGVDPSQVSTREVPANTPFALTFLEALMFLCRVEYSCEFTTESGIKGSMLVKASKFGGQNENVLPTPTFNLAQGGARDLMTTIDQKDDSGNWVVTPDPEFERFGVLLQKKSAPVSTAKSDPIKKATLTAAGLRQIFGF